MSTLVHDQGTAYVLTPYRERLNVTSVRDLRQKMRTLANQFGHYVALTDLGDHTYDAVFSNHSGHLLAECVSRVLPQLHSFVYVDVHEHDQCIVLVVADKQVLMDALVDRDQVIAQVMPYYQTLKQCEFLVHGMEWSLSDEAALVDQGIRVRQLEQSLWWGGSSLDCRLQALTDFLRNHYQLWYRRYAWPMAAVCLIAVLSVAVYRVSHQTMPVFVPPHQENVVAQFEQANLAADVLDKVSESMIRLQSFPGVTLSQMKWSHSRLRAVVLLSAQLRHHAWREWLSAHQFELSSQSGREILTQPPVNWAHPPLQVNVSAQHIFDALFDSAQTALGKANVIEKKREKKGRYVLIHADFYVKGMSAARLSLLADSLRRYSVTVSHLSLQDRKGLFWGSLSLTVWGV